MKNKPFVIGALVLFIIFVCASRVNLQTWYQKTLDYKSIIDEYDASEVTIAFIDTGISKELQDSYNVVSTYNSNDETTNVVDDCGHGTAMASIACGNGEKNVTGLAKSAKIIIIKAADQDGRMTLESFYKALRFARQKKCDIVNISLGGYKESSKVKNILYEMYFDDITVLASAGDYAQNDLLFPANYQPYVFAVQATNRDGIVWQESNTSKDKTLKFPGEDIMSLTPDKEIVISSGTSEATAIATSAVAIIKQAFYRKYKRKITNEELASFFDRFHYSDGNSNLRELIQSI